MLPLVLVVAVVLLIGGIATTTVTFCHAIGECREAWTVDGVDGRVLSLVVFWVLFPPMWFFTVYNCFDTQALIAVQSAN